MYLRLQIVDGESGAAVAALVVPAHLVSPETALRWAQAIAQDANGLAGRVTHGVRSMEHFTGQAKALVKLAGKPAGHGGNRTGKKPRGQCTQCGGVYPLNKYGQISVHGKQYGTRNKKRCAGSNQDPRVVPIGAKAQQLMAGGQ